MFRLLLEAQEAQEVQEVQEVQEAQEVQIVNALIQVNQVILELLVRKILRKVFQEQTEARLRLNSHISDMALIFAAFIKKHCLGIRLTVSIGTLC